MPKFKSIPMKINYVSPKKLIDMDARGNNLSSGKYLEKQQTISTLKVPCLKKKK